MTDADMAMKMDPIYKNMLEVHMILSIFQTLTRHGLN